MKVEIAETYGEAAIICYCGPDEVRVAHKELTRDAEGELLKEKDVMTALLNAAVAAIATIPDPEEAPEGGETKAERLEREEANRKALADWTVERGRIEEEEAAALEKAAAEAQAASAPAPEPQPEPQPV